MVRRVKVGLDVARHGSFMKVEVKDNRFLLHDLPFDRREEGRNIGGHWSSSKRLWMVPANYVSAVALASISKDKGYDDDLDQLFGWMANVFEAKKKALQGLTPNGQESSMKLHPMPHQEIGYRRTLWQKRLGLWWDMGCGKTMAALWIAQHLWMFEHKGRVLILCPVSLISTWQDEMKKHLMVKYSVYPIVGTKKQKTKMLNAWAMAGVGNLIFGIITWDTAKVMAKELEQIRLDYVIGDESSYVKNHAAQRTKAAIEIADRAEHVIALNGTPYVSDVRDLWSQIRFLSQAYAGDSYWRFVNRYVEFDKSPWHKPIGLRPEMKQELKRLLDVIGMSIRKEDVLKDLPPKSYQVRWVEAEGEQKKALDKAMHEFEIAVQAYKKGSKTRTEEIIAIKNAMARATRVQQISMGWSRNESGEIIRFKENPKADAFSDILGECHDKKVVTFSRFIEDLEILTETSRKSDRKPTLYHGGLPYKDAEANKYSFMHGDSNVFIGQVQKGSVGLNLQVSSICVFFNNWWSLGVRTQAEGRLHRKGQVNPVSYFDIMMKGSVDEKIKESFERGVSLVSFLFGKERGNLEDELGI